MIIVLKSEFEILDVKVPAKGNPMRQRALTKLKEITNNRCPILSA
jgi:hypothetical protein